MLGLPPGDHKAFSWDSTKESGEAYAGDWFDPTWLKPYEAKGVSVHLEEGDHKSVELEPVKRRRADSLTLLLCSNREAQLAKGAALLRRRRGIASSHTILAISFSGFVYTFRRMKILLFGATGSVGNSVLEACCAASIVEEVRAITRRPLMNTNSKLRTFVHQDFLNYATVQEAFRSIDACLFCLGISATQVSKEDYRKITYSYTLAAANMFKAQCPGAAFHYISGKGTSSASRFLWARVKAQTEYDLMELVDADCWRPAFIDAQPSASLPRLYALFFPLGRLFKPFPSLYVHGHDLARAMLQARVEKLRRRIIENSEIREIAARASF